MILGRLPFQTGGSWEESQKIEDSNAQGDLPITRIDRVGDVNGRVQDGHPVPTAILQTLEEALTSLDAVVNGVCLILGPIRTNFGHRCQKRGNGAPFAGLFYSAEGIDMKQPNYDLFILCKLLMIYLPVVESAPACTSIG